MKVSASLVAVLAASLVSGCGADDTPSDVEVESPIIGGSSVSIANQRTLGLVTVNDACSGALIARDWVITATHCANFLTPSANTVTCPRADMTTLERRTVAAVSQVGPTDVALMQLASSSSTTWPNVSRTTRPFAAGLGAALNCYGRGASQYAAGGGVTGFTGYRVLNAHVDAVVNGNIVTNANTSGSEVGAPGDSGGACFMTGQTVAIGSYDEIAACNDPTNDTTCANTVTRFKSTYWRAIPDFASYIDSAPTRTATATFQEVGTSDGKANFLLPNGWINHPYATDDAKMLLNQNTVYLRGGVQTSGSNAVLFQLPSNMRPSSAVFVPTNLCGAAKGRFYVDTQGFVTVQEENGDWAKAQCFTSLDGVSFAINNSSTTALPLINGWSNSPYSTRPAAVRVVDGVVRFQGAIAGGSNANPFVVPAGFRPVGRTVYLAIDSCNATKGRMTIDANGGVYVTSFNTGDSTCFSSLEGASYPLSGGAGVSLQNGWTNADANLKASAPGVTNIGGIIRFTGAMKTAGTNKFAFQLPANLRPATAVYVPIDLTADQQGRLFIQPSGWVQVEVPVGQSYGSAQAFTSLEGAWFGL